MEPAISIQGIGKKYIIRHKRENPGNNNIERALYAAKSMAHPIKNRSKEDFWALNNICFDVQPGESIGLIGKNGAGKSTLLKLISRITEPTTGKIIINGTVSAMLEVGTGFNRELTGRENVYLNGAILGMTRGEIDKKFNKIVEFSEIDKFIDTPVKRYSSGMFVRLAFAVASHLDPDIMVVDEVLAVGDSRFQKKCLEQMANVANSGRTVIYVSHNMATIRQLCSRVVFLKSGMVEFMGDVEQGISHYFEGGGGNELVKDVSNHRRGGWISGEVCVTRIEMLDTTDCVYEYDAPVKFRVSLTAYKDVEQANVRLDFATSSAELVGMCFTEPIGDLKGGNEYSFDIEFVDHRLAPDTYSIDLSISKGNNFVGYSTIDTVSYAVKFDILGRELNELRETWVRAWGHVHIPPAQITQFKQI